MAKSIKSITAYLVFEDFVNHKVPVRSISITSVAHNSMVASVEVHPNRHLMSMKRTIVVSLWCKYIDQTMCREEDYLIMKGSITSLQSSKSSNIKRYTLNLTDDRKFISDLPTKYLDLIQLQQEGYEEENYTIEDIFADLQYYNIKGTYLKNADNQFTSGYSITGLQAKMFMRRWGGDTFKGYIDKLFEPMAFGTCWEPYYFNHGNKRRVIDSHVIYDNHMYLSSFSADATSLALNKQIAESMLTGTKDNSFLTYDEVFARLSEIGYVYVSQPFPTYRCSKGGKPKNADSRAQFLRYPHHKELYSITPQRLWKEKNEHGKMELNKTYKQIKSVKLGTREYAADVYDDVKIAGEDYVVIYCGEGDNYSYADNKKFLLNSGNLSTKDRDEQVTQFAIMPKIYGTIPPKVNWLYLTEHMTFSSIITEPPVTAIKYRLNLNSSNLTAFCYSYPIKQKVEYFNIKQGLNEPGQGMDGIEVPKSVDSRLRTPYDSVFLGSGVEISSNMAERGTGANKRWHQGIDIALNQVGATKYREGSDKATQKFPVYAPVSGIVSYMSGMSSGSIAILSRGKALLINKDGGTYSNNNVWADWAIVIRHATDFYPPNGGYIEQGQLLCMANNVGTKNVHIHIELKMKLLVPDPKRSSMFIGPPPHGGTRWWESWGVKKWASDAKWNGSLHGPVLCKNDTGFYDGYPIYLALNPTMLWSAGNFSDTIVDPVGKDDTLQIGDHVKWDYPPAYNSTISNIQGAETSSLGSSEIGGEITEYVELKGGLGYGPEEREYGLKRSTYTGDAVYEMERAIQLIDSRAPGWERVMEAKVRNDYWEINTSGNSARVTIPGLRMHFAVGFPSIIYDPSIEVLYYGFVGEISHRIDNVDGSAYTEISLTNLSPIESLSDAIALFPGEEAMWLLGDPKNHLAKLNLMHHIILGPHEPIKQNEVWCISTKTSDSKRDSLGQGERYSIEQLMHQEYRRRLTTIDKCMGYFYGEHKIENINTDCYSVPAATTMTKFHSENRNWISDDNMTRIMRYLTEIATEHAYGFAALTVRLTEELEKQLNDQKEREATEREKTEGEDNE